MHLVAYKRHAKLALMQRADVETYFRMRAPRTEIAYRRLWRAWCAHCTWSKATERDAQRFIALTEQAGNHASTSRYKARILHGIYRYLQSRGSVRSNPWPDVCYSLRHARTGELRPSQPLPAAQVTLLLDAPSAHTVIGRQYRALLAILFSSCRIGETLELRLADIQHTAAGHWYLVLRQTKAGYMQRVAIANWAAERVLQLVTQRLTEGASMADMLFVSYSGAADCKRVDGKPLLARRVQRQLKRYAAAVGITAAISPHWGRCSAICRLLEQRCNYADIQAVTRHKSIATLEIYDRRRREIDDSVGNALQYGKVG